MQKMEKMRMKMARVTIGALLLFVLLSGISYAGKYGDGGCGLGSIIFGDNGNGLIQSFAWTTNVATSSQTIGITSGTSNCDATGLVVASRETEVYAQKNFDSIAKEMAVGTGEHLTTLAGLMGYEASQLASFGKTHYGRIFASESATSSDLLTAIRAGLAG